MKKILVGTILGLALVFMGLAPEAKASTVSVDNEIIINNGYGGGYNPYQNYYPQNYNNYNYGSYNYNYNHNNYYSHQMPWYRTAYNYFRQDFCRYFRNYNRHQHQNDHDYRNRGNSNWNNYNWWQ